MSEDDIRFECEVCHRPLMIEKAAAGRQVHCPDCGNLLTVPGTATAGPHKTEPGIPGESNGNIEQKSGEQVYARRSASTQTYYRYDVFISYRHVEPDRLWAEWLNTALETYRVPGRLVKERGLPKRIERVFRDEEELPASADLNKEIAQALEESRFLVVVCSPRTPKSEWVNGEVARFRELGRHDRILALLIEGEPVESFPRALVEIRQRIIDSTGLTREKIEEVEPLAADVRPSRKEPERYLKRMAKLRVLACILGCRFDDLRQREAERRKRFLAWCGAGAAVLLLVVGGLGYSVLRQMGEVRKHQRVADEQQETARQAKVEVEKKTVEIVRQKEQASKELSKQKEFVLLAEEKAKLEQELALRTQKQLAVTEYALKIREARSALDRSDRTRASQILEECQIQLRGWEWGYLQKLATGETRTQYLATRRVDPECVCFSSDQKLVAAGMARRISVFDALNASELFSLSNEFSSVNNINISRNGQYLTANTDNDMKIWNLQTRTEIVIPFEGYRSKTTVDLDNNLAGWIDRRADRLIVWNIPEKKTAFNLDGQAAQAMAFRPGGKHLAVLGYNKSRAIIVFDLESRRAVLSIPVTEISDAHSQIQFQYGRNGRNICLLSDENVMLFDATSGTKISKIGITDRRGAVISPDNRLVACGNDTHNVLTVLETQTRKEILSIESSYTGAPVFSGDSKKIFISNSKGMAVWDIEANRRIFADIPPDSQGWPYRQKGNPFSEDGTLLVYVGKDARLTIASLTAGRDTEILNMGSGGSRDVDFLAISSKEPKLYSLKSYSILNVSNYKTRQVFPPMGSSVRAMALSPDGSFLAYAGEKEINVHNLSDDKDTVAVQVPGTIRAMSLDKGARKLAVGNDKAAVIWDLENNTQLQRLDFQELVFSLGFHPKHPWLAIGVQNNLVKIYNWADGSEIALEKPKAGKGAGSGDCIALTPDGKYMAAASWRNLYVWNLDSRKLEYQIPFTEGLRAVISDTMGKRWITGEKDRIRFWNVETGQEVMSLPRETPVHSLAMDASGRHLASGGEGGKIYLISSSPVRLIQYIPESRVFNRQVAISPDGRWMATGGYKTGLHLWNVETPDRPIELCTSNTCSNVAALDFSPDSKQVIAAYDKMFSIWDIESGKQRLTMTNSTGRYPHYFSAYTPNSSQLVLATEQDFGVIDPVKGSWISKFNRPNDSLMNDKQFSISDRHFACYESNHGIGIWNLKTGAKELSLAIEHRGVGSTAFAADSKSFAYGAADHIQIVTLPEGKLLKEFTVSSYPQKFSYDGKRLAVARQKDVIVYDAIRGTVEAVLPAASPVISMDWSGPERNWLATATEEGALEVWNLEPDHEDSIETDRSSPMSYSDSEIKTLAENMMALEFIQRLPVIRTLAGTKDPRAAEVLVKCLALWPHDEHEPVIDALIEMGPVSVEPLLNALTTRKPRSSSACLASAAITLSRLKDPRAAQPLFDLYGTHEYGSDFTLILEEVLIQVGIVDWPIAFNLLPKKGDDLVDLIGRIGDRSIIPDLVKSLKKAEPGMLNWLIMTCGRIRAAEAAPLLEKLVNDPSQQKCFPSALRSLGEIGGTNAVNTLKPFFSHSNIYFRRAAVCGAGLSRDPRAIPPLLTALKDPDDGVRAAAAEACGRLRSTATVTNLIGLLNGTDRQIAEKAAEALGNIGDSRAVTPLITLIRKSGHGDDRKRAIEALGKIRSPAAIPTLIAVAGNSEYDGGAAEEAVIALGEIGNTSAVPALTEIFAASKYKNDFAITIIKSLEKMNARDAVPVLNQYFEKIDDRNKIYVTKVLIKLGDRENALRILRNLQNNRNGAIQYQSVQLLKSLEQDK